jgi:hypothetical protein
MGKIDPTGIAIAKLRAAFGDVEVVDRKGKAAVKRQKRKRKKLQQTGGQLGLGIEEVTRP